MKPIIHRSEQFEHYLEPETGDLLFSLPYAENGVVRDYHDDGRLKTEIGYKDGKRHGKMTMVEEDGAFQITHYDHGRENGLSQGFTAAGELDNEALILNDEVQWYQEYFPRSGKIKIMTPYENGKPHGDEKIYDEAGNVHETVPYVNGVKQGIGIECGANGTTFRKAYTNGELENPVREFNADNVHVRDYHYEMANGYKKALSEIVTFDGAGRIATREKGGVRYHFDHEAGVARSALCGEKGPVGRELVYDLDAYGDIIKNSARNNPSVRYIDGARVDLNAPDAKAQLTADLLDDVELDSTPMDKFRMDVNDMVKKASSKPVLPKYRFSNN